MTREQAINYLYCSGFSEEQVNEIVKALGQESTIKNDLGVYAVSIADAINAVSEVLRHTFFEHEDIANKIMSKLPSITPQEPRKGHWIETGDYFMGAYEDLSYYECSCCHENSLEEGDYCPNCGAKMESEVDNGNVDW